MIVMGRAHVLGQQTVQKLGDPYHLAFVTTGKRDAKSTRIEDYNAFVNEQAATQPITTLAEFGVQYFAVGSTPTVDAKDNINLQGDLFLLDGTFVADDSADLWDGVLNAPINLTQDLTIPPPTAGNDFVWTGASFNGFVSPGSPLGDPSPVFGVARRRNFSWVQADALGASVELRMYAVSEPLIYGDCNLDGTLSINDADCTSDADLDELLFALGTVRGDVGGDLGVDFADFLVFSANFGKPGAYTDGNFDTIGDVDFADFLIISRNFGKKAQAAVTVPEMSAFPWAAVLVMVTATRIERRRHGQPEKRCFARSRSKMNIFR